MRFQIKTAYTSFALVQPCDPIGCQWPEQLHWLAGSGLGQIIPAISQAKVALILVSDWSIR